MQSVLSGKQQDWLQGLESSWIGRLVLSKPSSPCWRNKRDGTLNDQYIMCRMTMRILLGLFKEIMLSEHWWIPPPFQVGFVSSSSSPVSWHHRATSYCGRILHDPVSVEFCSQLSTEGGRGPNPDVNGSNGRCMETAWQWAQIQWEMIDGALELLLWSLSHYQRASFTIDQ